ncbi:unnamed protein product [Rhodiola kirilowii]
MHFYLSQLGIGRYLTEETPRVAENETDRQVLIAYNAWKDFEYFCRNYVLNSLNDVLYKVYKTKSTAKEVWEALDRKYRTENAGSKKYTVGRFLEFQMVDSKTVTSQVHDLQLIMHEMHSEGMVVNEPFQVAVVIEKLPSGWKEFKNYLKHKRKEMSMEDLVIRLKNEEDNRSSDKRLKLSSGRANVVEHGESSKGKSPSTNLDPRVRLLRRRRSRSLLANASTVTKRITELLTAEAKGCDCDLDKGHFARQAIKDDSVLGTRRQRVFQDVKDYSFKQGA